MSSAARKRKDRRKYLRQKVARGTITDVEKAELVSLEGPEAEENEGAAPTTIDQPVSGASDHTADSAERAVIAETHGGGLPGTPAHVVTPVPPPIPPAHFPPASALPRPPRVAPAPEPEAKPEGKSIAVASGDWRAKYRAASGDGREEVCVEAADATIAALQLMVDQIKLSGVDPIIADPSVLRPAFVLSFDQLLPDRVRATPPMKAAGGSVAIIVQRFMRRKEIAIAQKTAEDRAKHDEFRRKQHLHSVPMPEATVPPAASAPTPPAAPQSPIGSNGDPAPKAKIVATDAAGGEWTQEMIDALSETDRKLIFPTVKVTVTGGQVPAGSVDFAFDPDQAF